MDLPVGIRCWGWNPDLVRAKDALYLRATAQA